MLGLTSTRSRSRGEGCSAKAYQGAAAASGHRLNDTATGRKLSRRQKAVNLAHARIRARSEGEFKTWKVLAKLSPVCESHHVLAGQSVDDGMSEGRGEVVDGAR
jgi:hypothetical protein